MRLPGSVREGVTQALREADAGRAIVSVSGVGGGCINHGARIDSDRGERFFLKWNSRAPFGMFEAEASGLRALRRAAMGIDEDVRPRVPAPLASGEGDLPSTGREDAAGAGGGPGWLLMEWISPGAKTPDADERLGRGLALLHRSVPIDTPAGSDGDPTSEDPALERGSRPRSDPAPFFGWRHDNWIGSLPQSNRETDSWAEFWRDRRIVPQLERARADGHLQERVMDAALDAIPTLLGDSVNRPELLHGDLWSGNSFTTDGGASALIDPAVYRGDGEVDLAMTELFGGFGPAFYSAYREARPVAPGYEDHRRALYQLYYLLVHVNLFGRGYVGRSLDAARRVAAAAR